MEVNLGERIKFFRKRTHKSQLELEVEINGSSGMISRIESNLVNPTKETVIKIADVLGLNNWELDYLIGKSALPVTQYEVDKAKQEAVQYLNGKGKLAYLIDDRWRFFMISDAFIRLLKIEQTKNKHIIGRTTVQVLTDKDSPILELLDMNLYEELLQDYLPTYYAKISHMIDDEIYQETLASINKNTTARKVWREVVSRDDRRFASMEKRTMPFNIFGVKFNLKYTWSELPLNSRFEIVECYAENKAWNLLKRFI